MCERKQYFVMDAFLIAFILENMGYLFIKDNIMIALITTSILSGIMLIARVGLQKRSRFYFNGDVLIHESSNKVLMYNNIVIRGNDKLFEITDLVGNKKYLVSNIMYRGTDYFIKQAEARHLVSDFYDIDRESLSGIIIMCSVIGVLVHMLIFVPIIWHIRHDFLIIVLVTCYLWYVVYRIAKLL